MDEKRMGEMALMFLRNAVKEKDMFLLKSLSAWLLKQHHNAGSVENAPVSLREAAEFTKAILG